jgi:hypothetical protein
MAIMKKGAAGALFDCSSFDLPKSAAGAVIRR